MSDEEKKPKLEPGTHKTTATGWGLRETNNGNLQLFIRLSVGAIYFQMVGNNEDGDKYAAEALAAAGFKGKDLTDLYDHKPDPDHEFDCFIKYTPNEETGEPEMKVFINGPAKPMKGELDKKAALKLLKNLKVNLKGQLKDAQVDVPVTEKKKSTNKGTGEEPTNDPDIDDDDIPF